MLFWSSDSQLQHPCVCQNLDLVSPARLSKGSVTDGLQQGGKNVFNPSCKRGLQDGTQKNSPGNRDARQEVFLEIPSCAGNYSWTCKPPWPSLVLLRK